MLFLTVTLFEFGQFLQILLWIALPVIMVSILVTVYVHHRKRTRQQVGGGQYWVSSADGVIPEGAIPEETVGRTAPEVQELGAEGQTVYQGLLWLKNRYEQDRELSTAKYIKLKEEHGQLKEKFLALETRHACTQELLNERQTTIDRLREQLEQETLRTAEVKSKLESSGHLLLKIHKELDQVLAGEAAPGSGITTPVIITTPAIIGASSTATDSGPHINAWVESEVAEVTEDPMAISQ